MQYFTPQLGLIGGSLIGAAAGTLLLLSGEILGASGLITAVTLFPKKALTDVSVAWKVLFMASFMLISNALLAGHFATDPRTGADANLAIASTYGYLVGGFFVGFGTKLGNGCTSGHGICGLARLSKRSFVAVASFMLSAIATASITAPDNSFTSEATAFLRTDTVPELFNQKLGLVVTAPLVLASVVALFNLWKAYKSLNVDHSDSAQKPLLDEKAKSKETTKPSTEKRPNRQERVAIQDGVGKLIPGMVAAVLFAAGLAVSGMVVPSKILGFLNPFLVQHGTWDPTLLMVMGGGSVFSWFSYQFVDGFGILSNKFTLSSPRDSSAFCIPTNTVIDFQLVFGATCFGIGWGIGGLCPGPALFLAAAGTAPIISYWWPTFLVGSYLAQKIKERNWMHC
eukprot:scaffold8114_cov126-Cylindrotheca_fusiformis.AAC.17